MKKYILTLVIAPFSFYAFCMQKDSITQHPIDVYERIDTCTAKYSVVHDWQGRCGIYDLENHKNLTELEYRQLFYTKDIELENGNKANLFYGKKGRKKGVVSVSPDGDVMFMAMDDPDEFYSLDSCRTIDEKLTKFCDKILKKNLSMIDSAVYGEILVMDTKTEQIKTWIAMEDEFNSGKFNDAKPRKHQCSIMPLRNLNAYSAIVNSGISLNDSVSSEPGVQVISDMTIIDDHYLGKTTYKEGFIKHSNIIMAKALNSAYGSNTKRLWIEMNNSPREINALTLATVYSGIVTNASIRPSVNSAAVCKEVLKATLQEDGIGSQWTTKKVDLSGDYILHHNCEPTLYDENSYEIDKWHKEHFHNYDQIIFTGYLPSDKPRYTICITIDAKSRCYPKEIGDMVNKVAEYLNKH